MSAKSIKVEIKEEDLSDLELSISPVPFRLDHEDEPFQFELVESESESSIVTDCDSKSLFRVSPIPESPPKTKSKTKKKNRETETSARRSAEVKLKLTEALLQTKIVNRRHNFASRKIRWDEINVEDCSKEELQTQLAEIIKAVGVVRTLREILDEYQKNHVKFERVSHPDNPVKPMHAFSAYLKDNREELEKELHRIDPKKSVNYMELTKFASEKFNHLKDYEKEPYHAQYKVDMAKYLKKKEAFLAKHPDLKTKCKRSSKNSSGQTKHAFLTPFLLYRDEMLKSGENVTYIGHQKLWKDMPDDKKLRYIKRVADKDTNEKKKISKQEWKILEGASGIPKRPMSAYNVFVKKYKETYKGDPSEFMTNASAAWNLASDDERQIYVDSHKELTKKWGLDLKSYIRKLPTEQQPMMELKYKDVLNNKKTVSKVQEKSKKSKIVTNTNYNSDSDVVEIVETTLKREKKKVKRPKLESPRKESTDSESEEQSPWEIEKPTLDSLMLEPVVKLERVSISDNDYEEHEDEAFGAISNKHSLRTKKGKFCRLPRKKKTENVKKDY